MEFPSHFRHVAITTLAERLDFLATYILDNVAQPYARIDKRAFEKFTSAGILTYAQINGKYYVLLSQRVRHKWWNNFGGHSSIDDKYLSDTAIREVYEESGRKFNYSKYQIENAPFHDLVTLGKRGYKELYRMYFVEHDYVSPNKIYGHEHTVHEWISVNEIISAVEINEIVICEGN